MQKIYCVITNQGPNPGRKCSDVYLLSTVSDMVSFDTSLTC